MAIDSKLETGCRRLILERLTTAGPAGLTITGLRLPSSGSKRGKACRAELKELLKKAEIGNLGSSTRPRYVAAEHFKPLELAYDHIDRKAEEAGLRISSKTALTKGLAGTVLKKADEALRLLVDEGVIIRLNWAGRPVYFHVAALPTQLTTPAAAPIPDEDAIREAYRETANAFGYPDVLVHEVYRRLGGDLEAFKAALRDACRTGKAVPSTGDWSLSAPDARAAALYIDGHPHLRIRFKD